MEVGCLGYPGASTVVSQPPDGLLHYWQISGTSAMSPTRPSTRHTDLVSGEEKKTK